VVGKRKRRSENRLPLAATVIFSRLHAFSSEQSHSQQSSPQEKQGRRFGNRSRGAMIAGRARAVPSGMVNSRTGRRRNVTTGITLSWPPC
jgi:hypothetical protein